MACPLSALTSPSWASMPPTRPLLFTSLLLLLHSLLPSTSAQSFLQTAPVVNVSVLPSTDHYFLLLHLSPSPSLTLLLTSAPYLVAHPANASSPAYYSEPAYPHTNYVLLALATPLLYSICSSACDVVVDFTVSAGVPFISYSLYPITLLPLNGALSLTLPPNTFSYFAYGALAAFGSANVTLSSLSTNTSLYVSSTCNPNAPFFLTPTVTAASNSPSVFLTSECLYVLGFSSNAGGAFNLSVVSTPFTPWEAPSGSGALTVNASEAFVLVITVVVVSLPLLLLCCMITRSYRLKRRMQRDANTMRGVSEADMRLQWRLTMEDMSSQALALSGQTLVPQPTGLTEAEIAALPVSLWRTEGGDDAAEGEERCAICLEEFEEERSVVKTLRCGHTLHRDCLDQWLRASKHCPLCLQRHDEARNVKRPSMATEVEMVARPKGEQEVEKEVELPLRIHEAPVELVRAAVSQPVGAVRDEECECCSRSDPPAPLQLEEEVEASPSHTHLSLVE